jgi:hypothetical protein
VKFFTSEWWANGSEDAEAVFERYERYLTSIRSKLPAPLITFEAEHTLHDAEVKNITSDFQDRTVVMRFEGWDRNLQYGVDYTLSFLGVSVFEQRLPEQEYVEAELGDLGYWECELISSGVEVRMLFVSSAEFRIVFTGFAFEHSRREA